MSCAPHYCDYHNTGTTTCSGHRASCATNRPSSVSGEFGTDAGRLFASDINNLRVNIRDELARWDLKYGPYTYLQAAAYIAGSTVIDNNDINDLDNMVAQIVGGWVTYGDGAGIDNTHWVNLKNRYDVMRTSCICNSDCACNYVCVCYGDCGCNY